MSQIQMQTTDLNEKHAFAIINVNGLREYQIFTTPSYCSIMTGHALKFRSVGKTYWSNEALVKSYKRDGATLLEIVNELRKQISDFASLPS